MIGDHYWGDDLFIVGVESSHETAVDLRNAFQNILVSLSFSARIGI